MKRVIILLFIFSFVSFSAACVPAYPHKVKVATEKGDTVEIALRGDEFHKFAISDDGFLLFPKNESWYYLKKDQNSGYSVSDIQIKKTLQDDVKENLISVDNPVLFASQFRSVQREKRQTICGSESHALVILIEYQDKKFKISKSEIDDLFNETGYEADNAEGSVRDYYRYVSYNEFDLLSDIYGPYTAEFPMNYYGGNNAYGNDSNSLDLALEAINSLPDDIDLSIYDNNKDGYVDNVHIIFAGYGEESGAVSSAIWSHEYPYPLPISKNGYKFAGYSCSPELRSNMGNGITRIGVICHELGHAFGANDYYDVDYSANGSFEGTGVWDLMASGSWNNNGISPANINPYIKIMDFRWVNPVNPEKSGKISLSSYNSDPNVLRIPTSNPNDYYLVEYRQKASFDDGLPGEGVLIYHVHPQLESRRTSNTINIRHPQCLYPVCASSSSSPFDTADYGNINSSECPFPGTSNRTQFSESTIPNVFQWDGGSPDFSLNNISLADDCALFDLLFDKQSVSDPISDSLVYHENFENGLTHFFNESIEGSVDWMIYPTNSLSSVNDMPAPCEGKYAIMLYDCNKSAIKSTSFLTSERIVLNPDSSYVMSFWITTKKRHSAGYYNFSLSIMNQSTYNWENVYESNASYDEWSEVSITLPKGMSDFHYQLNGEIMNSGIFIDDISVRNVVNTDNSTIVSDKRNMTIIDSPFCIVAHRFMNVGIYDLTGKMVTSFDVTPNETAMPCLAKGVYIVITDKGDKQKIFIY